jgi:predicted enzyme related to lactoylglutathione lyase
MVRGPRFSPEGIAEVVVFVPDLDVARRWYEMLFGPPAGWFDGYGWFQVAGYRVGLHAADAKTPAGTGGQVAYWRVDALAEALAVWIGAGARLHRGPVTGPDGISVAQVVDPFGNAWGLWEEAH